MRSSIFVSVFILATLPLAAGFAFAQDVQVQHNVPSLPVTSYPTQAPSQAGNMALRMAEMERQIRELTNQVEQRDHELRQLQKKYDAYVSDSQMRIKDMEARMANGDVAMDTTAVSDDGFVESGGFDTSTPAAPMPPQPTQNVTPVPGMLSDPDAPFQPDANAFGTPNRQLGQINESPNTHGDTVTSATPQPSNPAKDYDQAFAYLQQSNYVDAAGAFQGFLKSYPAHPLAANAKYWLGETYFAQTQYTTAAKTFARAYQEHPNGQKAPDSLLKLAVTLDKMNKKDDACLTLKELQAKFPSAPASIQRRSGEEQKRMGCAG